MLHHSDRRAVLSRGDVHIIDQFADQLEPPPPVSFCLVLSLRRPEPPPAAPAATTSVPAFVGSTGSNSSGFSPPRGSGGRVSSCPFSSSSIPNRLRKSRIWVRAVRCIAYR